MIPARWLFSSLPLVLAAFVPQLRCGAGSTPVSTFHRALHCVPSGLATTKLANSILQSLVKCSLFQAQEDWGSACAGSSQHVLLGPGGYGVPTMRASPGTLGIDMH